MHIGAGLIDWTAIGCLSVGVEPTFITLPKHIHSSWVSQPKYSIAPEGFENRCRNFKFHPTVY
jgi:hypothetical protein